MIEAEAAGALVLRAVVMDAGLINHAGQMPWMTRREAVVPAALDVEQFVKGIAVRQPGRAFLIGAEKVAVLVEAQADGPADAGAEFLAAFEVRRDAQDGPALAAEVVLRLAEGIELVGVVIKTHAQAEEDRAVFRIHTHARGVDAGKGERPAFGDGLLMLSLPITIAVGDHHDLAFAGKVDRVAMRRAFRREVHADGRGDPAFALPEEIGLILQPVAIRVTQKVDVAIVTERDEHAVVAVLEIDEVCELQRQGSDLKAGHEHAQLRRGLLRPLFRGRSGGDERAKSEAEKREAHEFTTGRVDKDYP